MKQAAIFDMDGLLFDTERLYQQAWVQVAKTFGFTPDPTFTEAICGRSGSLALETIRDHYPVNDAQSFWDACVDCVRHQIEEGAPKRPGADEILSFFHDCGIKMAVASGSDRTMVENNLRRAGYMQYFSAVVCGEDVEYGKPNPHIFLEAARRLGFAPENCYVFEDGVNGARAGIAAGCVTIMIPDLIQPTEDVRQGCAAICTSLHEVCEKLRRGLAVEEW